ncbi:hypothetical protein THAR02_07994 [Trichoderma harzianum]|uniref:Uncharacterized protein n=1 Tax=Trichoderma harzianum TaxID=5544 RepID=A0A0F9XH41_TRIHA|nr:hypothetical protein THAR02_07994 [Trichoderma harzianum]
MATVTAEDIRMVAERVRAAEQVVAPYLRREPYEFEVFEPLMKMLPEERVPFHPPPQRSDETDSQYHVVWRNHLNAWNLQSINDYFKVKGGRLLSPSSDIDDEDDVRAHQALRDQEKVLQGMGIVDWEYFRFPIGYGEPEIPLEFWESLVGIGASRSGNGDMASSSSTLQRFGPFSGNFWRSTEYGAGSAAEQQQVDGSVLYPSIEQSPQRPQSGNEMKTSTLSSLQNAEPALKRKRRSLPVEDDALERPSKKQMTDKQSPLSTALNTVGCKRKRDGEELLEELSTGKLAQPSDKKRRLDAGWKTQSSQKRKRSSQRDDEELQVPQLGYEVPETKRRRVGKTEVISGEQSAQDVSSAASSKRTLATSPSLRITRARRQQLSCEDAQLLQLDQRGKPGVQEPKNAAQKLVRELSAASRNGRRPKKATSTDAKSSRKTKTANATKAGIKASPTADTTTKTTAKTITRTRSRNTSSKIRGKDRPSST